MGGSRVQVWQAVVTRGAGEVPMQCTWCQETTAGTNSGCRSTDSVWVGCDNGKAARSFVSEGR